jgi:TPR repeat protein
LSADQEDARAQFNYGFMLVEGSGIPINKSLAAHYYKLSADQGDAQGQLTYGVMLNSGSGIPMNKSLAARYFKLSADQGNTHAQYRYGVSLLADSSCKEDHRIGLEYIELAAEGGFLSAQTIYAKILGQGLACSRNRAKAAHYLKLVADRGDMQSQVAYANCLLHGDGVKVNMKESERYFQLACCQGDASAKLRYGTVLLTGILGRFDFNQARNLFAEASSSNRTAQILHSVLSGSDDHLVTPDEYSVLGNVFSLLRSRFDERIPVIRLMNVHLCATSGSETQVFEVWKDMTLSSIKYLLDLSHINSAVLGSLSIDLGSCTSISEMIPLIFKMYSIQSQLYKNVNCLLRNFPVRILGKFMKELRGLLSYCYLLQSSIDYYSRIQSFPSDLVVYRGIQSGGRDLANRYDSMIGEMIVWPGFTSTSTNCEYVIRRFAKTDNGVLFEILLHRGNVMADIHSFSDFAGESEILIAASSVFRVLEVTSIEVPIPGSPGSHVRMIPKVKLSCEMSWFEFNIDSPPPPLLF